jgi:cell cycle sensor histidine kinase DivJ
MTASPPPLALLAHELRTPLNAIIGYAEAMTLGVFGPLNAPYDQQAAIIHGAALHLKSLVEDLTASAEATCGVWTPRPERFDPATEALSVASWLAPRASEAGLALDTDLAVRAGEVVADRRAFRQILLNLLDNALKFTGPGGRVALRVAWEGDQLRVVVADTGPGTSGPLRPPEGSGLGLALVEALCAARGGAMSVETPPSGAAGGRTVRLRLPAVAPDPAKV